MSPPFQEKDIDDVNSFINNGQPNVVIISLWIASRLEFEKQPRGASV